MFKVARSMLMELLAGPREAASSVAAAEPRPWERAAEEARDRLCGEGFRPWLTTCGVDLGIFRHDEVLCARLEDGTIDPGLWIIRPREMKPQVEIACLYWKPTKGLGS